MRELFLFIRRVSRRLLGNFVAVMRLQGNFRPHHFDNKEGEKAMTTKVARCRRFRNFMYSTRERAARDIAAAFEHHRSRFDRYCLANLKLRLRLPWSFVLSLHRDGERMLSTEAVSRKLGVAPGLTIVNGCPLGELKPEDLSPEQGGLR